MSKSLPEGTLESCVYIIIYIFIGSASVSAITYYPKVTYLILYVPLILLDLRLNLHFWFLSTRGQKIFRMSFIFHRYIPGADV